ncbi:MAG: anti-sigma factor, partial [Gemmatimonadaceae bacterium]
MIEFTDHLDLETLSAHADGELNAVVAARAKRHLDACAACRAQLEGVRHLVAAAHDLPRSAAPPPEVWTEIRARIARERAGTSAGTRTAHWWHNGWLAAAAALVLVAGT